MSYTDDHVTAWADAVSVLHADTAHNFADEQRATRALANVWSGFGWHDAPPAVFQMLIQATEAGYLAAINDLRDGELDDEIEISRPELAGQ